MPAVKVFLHRMFVVQKSPVKHGIWWSTADKLSSREQPVFQLGENLVTWSHRFCVQKWHYFHALEYFVLVYWIRF
jgi:hypothetical protein